MPGRRDEWLNVPAILDKELSEPDSDAFGHVDLELALRHLIESEDFTAPYSIGLLGKWGVGKSSVRAMYESRLANDDARGAKGKKRSQRIRPIPFNAWRFGGDNIKRALLRHIFLNLGGEEADLRNELYEQVQRFSTEKRSRGEIVADVLALFKAVGFQLLLLSVISLAVAAAVVYLYGIGVDLAVAVLFTAAIGTGPLLARYLLNPIPWRANVTRLELPSTTAEQYEEFLIKQLRKFRRGDTKIKGSAAYDRIVIFVDDLDRLSAEEMVDSLDAVRGFMDLPNVVQDIPGIVFVISCDEDKVADALADRRRRVGDDLPSTIVNREDARRFLDRIFQFRLEIPPMPKRDMREYAKKRLSEDLPTVARDLEARGVGLDQVVDTMIHPMVRSPRTVVHMLNAFSRSWWLARRREARGGTSRAGGLRERAVTEHPKMLAALSTLQVDFPDFYDQLQRRPNLLEGFIEVFIANAPLSEQGEDLQFALNEYLEDPPNTDGNDTGRAVGEDRNRVKAIYRPLRTYMSSVRTLRRPRDLRPLIFLAQDRLSQRLTAGQDQIRDKLTSADATGVLEDLGRARDDQPLRGDEIDRIKDVVEDTAAETPDRRDNVGVVLSEISSRLPADRANELLGPLSSMLYDSVDLRSKVGVARMAEILPSIRAEDRRALAGRLIDDFLSRDDGIGLLTTNLEQPSLNEAMQMVRIIVPALLETRQEVALPTAQDSLLLGWMPEAAIQLGDERWDVPFDVLDEWVSPYEDGLLIDIGENYTRIVVSLAHSELSAVIASEGVLARTRKVFQSMLSRGDQSRSRVELWSQLTDLVSSPEPAASELAWQFVRENSDKATSEQIDAFVKKLGDTLLPRPTRQESESVDATT